MRVYDNQSKNIALKSVMVLHKMLQENSLSKATSTENSVRRLQLWKDRKVNKLRSECKAI